MDLKDEKFKELTNKGYRFKFFSEVMNFTNTGTYTAYNVSVEKNGIEKANIYSLKSFETALDLVLDLLKSVDGNSKSQTKLKL